MQLDDRIDSDAFYMFPVPVILEKEEGRYRKMTSSLL